MTLEELRKENLEYGERFRNAFSSCYGFSFDWYVTLMISIAKSGMYRTNRAAFAQAVTEYENRIRNVKRLLSGTLAGAQERA